MVRRPTPPQERGIGLYEMDMNWYLIGNRPGINMNMDIHDSTHTIFFVQKLNKARVFIVMHMYA